MLRFSDGMEFDTSGPARVEQREDGYYVVGRNMLIPVDSDFDGEAIARKIEKRYGGQEETQETEYTGHAFESFKTFVVSENSLKDLVGKSDDEELDLDDARSIGKRISRMKGADRKKYVGIVNFMGASCRIYNEIWANYKPVDPNKKKSNKGKEFQGQKEVG
jgi:hypothetical protein